jgi:ribosomal protein L37AE/L43A
MPKILKKRIKCPTCGSLWNLHRTRTDTYLCRKCGQIFKRPKAPPEQIPQ